MDVSRESLAPKRASAKHEGLCNSSCQSESDSGKMQTMAPGPTLMRQYADNGFRPIEVNGLTIHPMFRSPIAPGDRFRVTWLAAASPRVQGLALRVRLPDVPGRRGEAGLLEAEGASSASIHLWMDTAPPIVGARCIEAKPDAELRVSNRWRLDDGREDEWLNNFGMLVEDDGAGGAVLRCADGYGVGPPSFDDLVVHVERLT
jgi:hypothetical protein